MKHSLLMLVTGVGLGTVFCPDCSLGNELGLQTTSVRTNWVDRWITNTAEVQMQVNRFVLEYRTNWVTLAQTNLVNLFSTNIVTRYHTNRIQQFRTNFVDVLATNFIGKTVTNTLVLDQIKTNFVVAYHTNLQTLHLTNWTTVLAFKTNWVTKPLTNMVEIEMNRDSAVANPPAVLASIPAEPLVLQAARGSRISANNQVEVQLTAAWTQSPATPVHVQQWRIEREDGSILFFGQDPEFKRTLPVGTYKVMLKAQRNAGSPLLAALGTLTVTSREVLLEQRPVRSNTSI